MPTLSNSFSFLETRDQVCTAALTNLGIVRPGKAATGDELQHAQQALNRLVKSIDPEGMHLWKTFHAVSLTTTAGLAFYTVPTAATDNPYMMIDGPLRYIRAGATSATNIYEMSRDDYAQIADRTSVAGVPTMFYQRPTGAGNFPGQFVVLYLWPVPDATGDTVNFAAMTRARDMVTGDHLPDFPQHWIRCLVYGLSMELAPTYRQLDMFREYRSLYEKEKAKLLASDAETGNLTLVPFGSWGGGW